jgi:hypothetical protein
MGYERRKLKFMPKQNMIPYSVHNDGSLRMGQAIFHPWPRFKITGLPVEVPKRLHLLLTSSDTIPTAWRKEIPPDVLQALLEFDVELLHQLFEIAQVDPGKFVDWADFCPALILLINHHCRTRGELDKEKVFRLFHFGWRTVLVEHCWPPNRSTIRILQKVKTGCMTDIFLGQLRQHIRCRYKLRLIRHLKCIDTAVVDTLHLPYEVLSVRLLELASERSDLIHAHSIRELAEEIMHFRREVKRFPVWPFRNGQLSEETLYHAEQLLLMHQSMRSLSTEISFQKPPFQVFKSSKFEARPVRSARELYLEGLSMRNCLPGYAARIASGSYYAYRIIRPERASLLLFKSEKGWVPLQLKTKGNGDPQPSTKRLVQAWLGQSFSGKEVEDAPF